MMLPRPGPFERVVKRQHFWDGCTVDLVRRWRWDVDTRYTLGPFSPRINHLKFRHRRDAETMFLALVREHPHAEARPS